MSGKKKQEPPKPLPEPDPDLVARISSRSPRDTEQSDGAADHLLVVEGLPDFLRLIDELNDEQLALLKEYMDSLIARDRSHRDE